MSYNDLYTDNERWAYSKGYNYGFWVGLFTGALLMFAAGLLIGRYVPL